MTTPSNRSPGATTPVVLISPAMAIGSRFYTPLVSAFTERGWLAQTLPRRGFEPDQPRASRTEDWSYGDEIDTIASAVRAARRDHPARPVIILGHSLGAQLAAGHELNFPGADGLVTVGGCIPHFRHYPRFGLPVAAGAALIPAITTTFGFVPEPAFGAPGARTLMREWAKMVLTGRPPFPAEHTIDTAALIISLEGDTLAPRRGVDSFARELFGADRATRWDYTRAEVPAGASNDHITWVRSPGPVVDRIVAWWSEQHHAHQPSSAIGHFG
ncbi:serine aminopeptidase domain-containing protein [Nocardia caishijiensis]|uniref:Alpha/beta hydrolase n=1 Tax=Nocardia caishijiensis TaxID=184756 RepID=A0ABQ6YHM2_9NOCA|nr:alpha/beta hydrolase [Nocardia caishijiensis]KAF0845211.1 putative alpha/beta hydrolase [Nocardia caishijiensis]